jgi:hypothetical protein
MAADDLSGGARQRASEKSDQEKSRGGGASGAASFVAEGIQAAP